MILHEIIIITMFLVFTYIITCEFCFKAGPRTGIKMTGR